MLPQAILELDLSQAGCCSSLERTLSEILPSEENGPGRNPDTIPCTWYLPVGYLVEGIVVSNATSCKRLVYDWNNTLHVISNYPVPVIYDRNNTFHVISNYPVRIIYDRNDTFHLLKLSTDDSFLGQ